MKIAVCVPVHRSISAEFFKSYTLLVQRTLRAMPDAELVPLIAGEASLEIKRNRLVVLAKRVKADRILWMDDDHAFPPDALLRLLTHDLPIVGCNYVTKERRGKPTAFGTDGNRVWTTEALAKAGEVQQVRSLGLGLCLMKAEIFDKLDEWARTKGGKMAWPLFDSIVDHEGVVKLGEDTFFFHMAASAGVPVFLDHALSWQVAHVAQLPMFNSDAQISPERERPAGSPRPAPPQ